MGGVEGGKSKNWLDFIDPASSFDYQPSTRGMRRSFAAKLKAASWLVGDRNEA